MGQRPCRGGILLIGGEPGVGKTRLAELLLVLGGYDPPDNLVNIIFEDSGGNALYVQSMYQSLAEEDRLFNPDGTWLTDVTHNDLVVPDDVRLIIERRVERLGENTRTGRWVTGANPNGPGSTPWRWWKPTVTPSVSRS